MIHNKSFKIASLVIFVIAAGYLYIWWGGSDEFKFTELAAPKGFRALVLNNRSSTALATAPLFGLSEQTNAPMEGFCDILFNDSSSPVLGPKDAEIDIVEFFDYRCPYCRVLKAILFELKEERSVRIIYKEWPILSESSKLAARAALGAANQGKYFEFHSRLMKAGFLTTEAYVRNVAVKFDVDSEKLLKDMQGPEITAALERNAALAIELGIIGTPTLVVGRTIIQGAITKKQLERLINIENSSPKTALC